MPADKKNEFLDAGDSDEDVGRVSESEDELRKGGRNAKRRRVEDDDDDSDVDNLSDRPEEHSHDFSPPPSSQPRNDSEDEEGEEGEADGASSQRKKTKTELPGVTKPLTKKNLVATEAAIKKSGVVYISRVPPYMTPAKLRSLLEPYGKINRLFLAPEDPQARTRRIKNGGNKKRSFTEGWVEFVRKKDAKKACELLNAQTIGGKKGSYYRDDIWNLLYLSGFKWHNLTEQINAENAERAARMRVELDQSAKENKVFVSNVEKGKMLEGIHAKAAAKAKKTAPEDAEVPARTQTETTKDRRRTFTQVPLAKKRKAEDGQSQQVQRVLSKIF